MVSVDGVRPPWRAGRRSLFASRQLAGHLVEHLAELLVEQLAEKLAGQLAELLEIIQRGSLATKHTGSFRKNDKSKIVSIGINFHKYCFF